MGIVSGLIFPCALGCGTGAVGKWVCACVLGSVAGKGDGVIVAVSGRGVGDGMGAGRDVARHRFCAFFM